MPQRSVPGRVARPVTQKTVVYPYFSICFPVRKGEKQYIFADAGEVRNLSLHLDTKAGAALCQFTLKSPGEDKDSVHEFAAKQGKNRTEITSIPVMSGTELNLTSDSDVSEGWVTFLFKGCSS